MTTPPPSHVLAVRPARRRAGMALPPLAGFGRRLRIVLAALCRWQDRWNQRHDLAGLDDRLLADIGVTRAEAERECARSPGAGWR